MSYDHRCFALATEFLAEYPDIDTTPNTQKLAQFIQDHIEQWIEAELFDRAKT